MRSINLEVLIIGVVYLRWGAFSLVCVLFVFFSSFLSSFFFLFLSVFSLTGTNGSQNSREERGNHCFSCFPLPPAHEHSFSSLRFLPLLLFSLEISIFIGANKSELLILTFQSHAIRSSYRRCSVKKVFFEISQNSQEKTPVPETLFK